MEREMSPEQTVPTPAEQTRELSPELEEPRRRRIRSLTPWGFVLRMQGGSFRWSRIQDTPLRTGPGRPRRWYGSSSYSRQ